MTRHSLLYLFVTVLITMVMQGCNSSDAENFQSESDLGNCAVTSFSLVKNDSVVQALDSVFFSIDLINARIYNADSLPVGTKVSKLQVKIGTASATAIDLTYRIAGTSRDTTVSYIDSPNDSINFADGPVKLHVRAADNTQTRDYQIQVNVHKSVPDTLVWTSYEQNALFDNVNTVPAAITTVELPGTQKVISLGAAGQTLYEVRDLSTGARTERGVLATLPAGADLKSFEAISENEFAIVANGHIYTATGTPDALSWSDTGVAMDCVYGVIEGTLLGARHDADGWKAVSYPASTESALPADFPVAAASRLVCYTNKWSASPLGLIVGGCKADGSMTGDAWAYDGGRWGKVSTMPLPAGEGYAVFPYNTPRVNQKNWAVSERSALLAMGALTADEDGGLAVSKTVYISYDWGITWRKADDYLQLPDEMTAFYGADAYVGTQVLTDAVAAADTQTQAWTQLGVRRLPTWCKLVPMTAAAPVSRIAAIPDEWDCPYIYVFGGENAAGQMLPIVRRGVIARYTFSPIY